MTVKYDNQNVFAKIIRGEIPSKKVYEDEMVLAFHDVSPVAPTHVLVIPKGEYTDYTDFVANASDKMKLHYFNKVKEIAESLKIDDYRLVANTGPYSGQTVFHFHMHIIGGKQILGLIG